MRIGCITSSAGGKRVDAYDGCQQPGLLPKSSVYLACIGDFWRDPVGAGTSNGLFIGCPPWREGADAVGEFLWCRGSRETVSKAVDHVRFASKSCQKQSSQRTGVAGSVRSAASGDGVRTRCKPERIVSGSGRTDAYQLIDFECETSHCWEEPVTNSLALG
jgi:hypothetical protein